MQVKSIPLSAVATLIYQYNRRYKKRKNVKRTIQIQGAVYDQAMVGPTNKSLQQNWKL